MGKFEIANGGTLFLDEIGDMPLKMQVNLLRVIADRSIVRIGGSEQIPVDV
jgi:transcriptional regulator with PAS, ATPase and Fis domain